MSQQLRNGKLFKEFSRLARGFVRPRWTCEERSDEAISMNEVDYLSSNFAPGGVGTSNTFKVTDTNE